MKRLICLAICIVVGLGATGRADAQSMEEVRVSIEPMARDVVLGEDFDVAVTVVNESSEPTPPLVVHIDITDPAQSTSVDPEDWTATLSREAGVVGPGETVTIDWKLQPIAPGSFVVYSVALSPDADTVASSNVLHVGVADRRSLNPGGILPVAIGAPAFVGALLLVQMRMARRGALR